MTAKEMFEELKYYLDTRSDEYELIYVMKWEISTRNYVVFDLKNKTFNCMEISDSPFEPSRDIIIDMKLLQAINKQVEELGWK